MIAMNRLTYNPEANYTLDALGRLNVELSALLEQVRERLHEAMCQERVENGATYAELMKRSGYRSIEQVRQVVKPGARERVLAREKARRSAA